jgi:hypothetical protein
MKKSTCKPAVKVTVKVKAKAKAKAPMSKDYMSGMAGMDKMGKMPNMGKMANMDAAADKAADMKQDKALIAKMMAKKKGK